MPCASSKVAGKRIAEHFGARIKLVEIGERVQNTLKLGLLLPLFEAYDSEAEALVRSLLNRPSPPFDGGWGF